MSSSSETPEPITIPKSNGPSAILGLVLMCILYGIPLAVVYSIFYYKNYGFIGNLFLIAGTYLLGLLAIMLYYRIVIANDPKAQISKMAKGTTRYILGTTFIGFKVVALTIVALAVSGNFVKIFENTIGYTVLQFLGLRKFMNDAFVTNSEDLKKLDLDYSFLITPVSIDTVEDFAQYITANEKQRKELLEKYGDSNATNMFKQFDLAFDFKNNNVDKLRGYVNTKYTVGHFVWVYMASIISLIISATAIMINYG
jgi:hypothetical protein